jgi:Ca2+-binding RTX toxin-like protein
MTVAQNSIVELYVIYFNRAPDSVGLQFWSTQDITIEEMAAQFGASPEAKALYPFLESPTLANPEEFINEIYQNAFGRDAEQAGLDFWIGVLEDDSSPEAVAEFVLTVAQAAQGTDLLTLQNRTDIALQFTEDFVNAGIAFTSSVLTTSSQIIDTVDSTGASLTAAQAAIDQAIIDIIGGGTGTTFTLLQESAVLTAAASNGVSPAGKFLSTANDQINGTVFLDGTVIQDPSTSDNDVLTATILPDVFDFQTIPFISKIENIKLTGSPSAVIEIANISDVKNLEIVTGNLTVLTSEKHPLNLAEGYSGTLSLLQANENRETTINLNGTLAGTRIVDSDPAPPSPYTNFKNNASDINLVVKADSVLKASDITNQATILDDGVTNTNFVISGDKNLTIEGAVQMALINSTAQLDASALTGKLTLNLANIGVVVDPFSVKQIVGGKSDDTFTLTAITDQLVGVAINGGDGEDTITASLGVDNIVTPTALNGVTNVETVIVKQTSVTFVTNLKPADSFVASGQSATVDGSSFTSSKLNYDGSLESNGTLNIIGGANADTLVGGAKNDTLTGGGLGDTLSGGGGNDTFVYKSIADSNADAFLTQLSFDTITDFQVAGDVLDLKAAGFTSSQFLSTYIAPQATLLQAAQAVSFNIGKNSLAAFRYIGAEAPFTGNTFVLGTNNSDVNVVDAGDLFIQLNGALTLTSVNFA